MSRQNYYHELRPGQIWRYHNDIEYVVTVEIIALEPDGKPKVRALDINMRKSLYLESWKLNEISDSCSLGNYPGWTLVNEELHYLAVNCPLCNSPFKVTTDYICASCRQS